MLERPSQDTPGGVARLHTCDFSHSLVFPSHPQVNRDSYALRLSERLPYQHLPYMATFLEWWRNTCILDNQSLSGPTAYGSTLAQQYGSADRPFTYVV